MAVFRHYPYAAIPRSNRPVVGTLFVPPPPAVSHEYLAALYRQNALLQRSVATLSAYRYRDLAYRGPRNLWWIEPANSAPVVSGHDIPAWLALRAQILAVGARRDYVWSRWPIPRAVPPIAYQVYARVPKSNQDILVATILAMRAVFMSQWSTRYDRPSDLALYPRKRWPIVCVPAQDRPLTTWTDIRGAGTATWTDVRGTPTSIWTDITGP